MYDAMDYYVESDDLLDRKKCALRVNSLVNTIQDKSISDATVNRIRGHSAEVWAKLHAQFSELISKTGLNSN